MKISFQVDAKFLTGINRLAPLLGITLSEDGIPVSAVCGQRIGASLADGAGTIYYRDTHHFFRELGVFVEHAKKETAFDITEDGFFKTQGVMFNNSENAVPTVASIQQMTDYLALMGYNMILLYTEDTIELKNRPYFGYMRGRYSKEELMAIDDYAYEYGIEVIGCLECYGHMSAYLKWGEAAPIKDTASVLLAREDKTFEFLDELIGHVSSCLRSKRIHIGMDEAWDMGRGAFLDRNGYVPPIDIFNEYMERLITITDKYGMTPMMWSDMYFRASSADGNQYYKKDTVISEETKKSIPEGVQMVFWHYGEEPHCDEYMIQKHQELNRDIIFAGGLWDWSGAFPEHNYAFEATQYSLAACRKYNVQEMMMTSWSSSNWYANLFGLSFSAEMCYHENPSEDIFRSRFEACTGGNYDAFYDMSKYHNHFEETDTYPSFHSRFFGKALFWQDIMEGMYDYLLTDRPMSAHYKACYEQMKNYSGKWQELYDYTTKVFAYLAVKTEIAEKLVPAYQQKDRDSLQVISQDLLPKLKTLTEELRQMYFETWLKTYKMTGWWSYDYLYSGMIGRCDTAKTLIDAYLAGKVEKLDELEGERLGKPLSGFGSYIAVAMPLLK